MRSRLHLRVIWCLLSALIDLQVLIQTRKPIFCFLSLCWTALHHAMFPNWILPFLLARGSCLHAVLYRLVASSPLSQINRCRFLLVLASRGVRWKSQSLYRLILKLHTVAGACVDCLRRCLRLIQKKSSRCRLLDSIQTGTEKLPKAAGGVRRIIRRLYEGNVDVDGGRSASTRYIGNHLFNERQTRFNMFVVEEKFRDSTRMTKSSRRDPLGVN
jgi:hypothetical protein